MNHQRWLLVSIMAFLGCGSPAAPTASVPATGSPSTTTTKPKAVTIALNWFPEAEHGGFYAALVHGYYAEAGLDVTIQPGGPNSPVLQQTAAGRVDFAVDNADKLLLARAQEADVVAVMAPIQNSPRCLLVHADEGIVTFDDLTKQSNFTIAMSAGQPFARFLTKRLDLSGATIVPYAGNVAPFLLNKQSALQGYSFSEPFVARKQGADPKLLMVSDLGFNTYTSLLVTSRSHLEQQPDLVKKVVAASIRGWQKYLEAPDETNAHIHQVNPEMDLDVLAYGATDLKPLCLPEGTPPDKLGTMTAERWQTLVDQLRDIDALTTDAVRSPDSFTNRFLPAQ